MFDKETWIFINTFSSWFSAIGTLAAVIISLYLARRERKIQLKVSAGHRLMLIPGRTEKPIEYLNIDIVNVGARVANITNIGWSIGFLRKRVAVQMTIQDGFSSKMPTQLDDGERASYYIPLYGEAQWLETFAKDFLGKHPRVWSRTIKIIVHTSVGKVFTSRIEKGLRDELVKSAKLQQKKRL
jgi:hypothetical protein